MGALFYLRVVIANCDAMPPGTLNLKLLYLLWFPALDSLPRH